jgi:hypothetical protein
MIGVGQRGLRPIFLLSFFDELLRRTFAMIASQIWQQITYSLC